MKKLLILLLVCTLIIQCQSNQKNLIQKDQVGLINKATKVSELDQIFKTDSLVKPNYQENQPKYRSEYYEVYGKKGVHLLTINIENTTDSTATIQNVLIFSSEFKTKSGVSVASLFKELKEKYNIEKVESTINSASVYVKDLNASFNIDNKDLGLAEFNTNKITAEQIPDNASFRYITVWFN